MVAYLEACLEEAPDDAALLAKALGDIARARGMVQLAKDTGLTREGLYKALSKDGNPRLDTVLKVMRALGLRFTAQAVSRPLRPPNLPGRAGGTELTPGTFLGHRDRDIA